MGARSDSRSPDSRADSPQFVTSASHGEIDKTIMELEKQPWVEDGKGPLPEGFMIKIPEILNNGHSRLETVYGRLCVSEDARRRLAHPKLIVQVRIPVRMDDGSLQVFPAWRVQYDDTRGPTKGGIRFHPNVSEEEVAALSFWFFTNPAG